MEKRVTKQFSAVRFWRYVFTPILLIALGFGIFMLYTNDATSATPSPSSSSSFRSTLNSLAKAGTLLSSK